MRVYKDIYINEKAVWIILLVSIAFNVFLFSEVKNYIIVNKNLTSIVNELESSSIVDQDQAKVKTNIFVQIEGAVNSPGVYEFDNNIRVFDLVDEAGGFLSEANRASVNLVRQVFDGEIIYIPLKGEVLEQVISSPYIDINRSSLEDLMSLPGIGETKAKEIVKFRETNGPFITKEDILKVAGIGPVIYDKIESSIVVN